MGCEGCGSSKNGTSPKGCKNNGHCSSGGCSRLEVYDWLADLSNTLDKTYDIHEISFKKGARKGFFRNKKSQYITTGDYVMVESSVGYNIGKVSLSGELVKLQMKKKRIKETSEDIKEIIRVAKDPEMKKLKEARSKEKETMLRARVIARSMNLNMKLGDVEYQADLRKAIFFYTADERVDFRELIKKLANEFKVRIEMRQIGARQEAGRIGGIGSCGRELCCSTWLTKFKSVNTSAARYQNLSINQTKLSGQCGRLKCCLNYELDTYLDALKGFPKEKESKKIITEKGEAFLVKTDILKGIMYYQYKGSPTYYPIDIEKAKEILALNKENKKAEDLSDFASTIEEEKHVFEDVVGQISLSTLNRADRKRKKRKKKPNTKNTQAKNQNNSKQQHSKKGKRRNNKS